MNDRRIFIGIFLLSLSLLLFELTLIRVYSAILFYHFAFMAISVAMLGLAAAALTVHLNPHKFRRDDLTIWGFRWGTAFAVGTCVSLWLVFRIPVNAYLPPDQIAGKLVVIYVLSTIPFYFAGLVVSGLFASMPVKAGRLYAWDLVGAGLGGLAIIPLMNSVGGESAGLVIMMIGFISAGALGGGKWKTGAILAAAGAVLAISNPAVGWLKITYSKGQHIDNLDAQYNKWNSFSRIMVIPFKIGTDAAPQTWCPSPNYLHLLPRNIYHGRERKFYSIMIDDGASTPVVPFENRNLDEAEFLKYDLTSIPHRLNGDGTTLVIGSGGGRDVLTGLAFSADRIDAVDINPLIFDAMNGHLRGYAGNLYHHPKVEAFTAEGRAFARSSPGEYDLIQVAMIDTWAATTAGAYSLSENALYTVEAFQDYLHALKPGGMISFTRFFFQPPRQALRLVSIFLEAAEREGIEYPERCILSAKYESLATVVFKNEPFTREEVNVFLSDIEKLGFHLVYSPDVRPDPFFRGLVAANDRNVFYESYLYDISPPTDNRPFFFNMLKIKDFLKVFEEREGQKFNYYATYTLIMVLIISVAATLLTLILPTGFKGAALDRFPRRVFLLGYFVAIGLAYLTVEVALLQRFALLLEHPAYAASGVIAGLLISSGLGSMVWGRTQAERKMKVFNLAFIGIGLGLLFHALIGSAIMAEVIHLPLAIKGIIAALLLLPLGFAMGIPLPAGINLAGQHGARTIAWCWALNGAASVVASSLAVVIAMSIGFSAVIRFGLICYFAAYVLISYFVLPNITAVRREIS